MGLPDDPGKHASGYPSSMTDDQMDALREVWRFILDILDKDNPNHNKDGGGDMEDFEDEGADRGKGALKGSAKDDSAKDKARREKEKKHREQILKSLTVKQLRDITWRSVMADAPDSLVARFGRARGWDPDATFNMMCSSAAWRHQMMVPDLLSEGEVNEGGFRKGLGDKPADAKEAKRFMKQYHDGKSYCIGTDRAGRPMAVINVKVHTIGGCSSLSLQRYVIQIIEMMRTALVPPAEEGTVIFNMKGFGLANWDFWAIKLMIDVFASYYPQTIHKIVIYHQPFYFWPFYKIVEPILPAEIRDKVVFASNLDELLAFVDRQHLPKDLGGDCQNTYSYKAPSQDDEEVRPKGDSERDDFFQELDDLNVQFEDATRKWIKLSDKGASQRDIDKVLDLRDAIQARRYVLCRKGDPLWRASTVISREGNVREYGRTAWTYKQSSGKDIVEKWGVHSFKILDSAPPLPGEKKSKSSSSKKHKKSSSSSKKHKKSSSKRSKKRDDDDDDEDEDEDEEDGGKANGKAAPSDDESEESE